MVFESCIKYGSSTSGYDHEGSHLFLHGGNIFWDGAIGIIWIENHVSLGAGETGIKNNMPEKISGVPEDSILREK